MSLMNKILTLHRCKHCGYLLDDLHKKYHPDCALIVERNLNIDRQTRFREKHGSAHVVQWCKKNPEKRKKHLQTYSVKHRQERVDYNRNYRATHPKWYRNQCQKNNKKLYERRHTPGNCPKCGREANKSSHLGFCTLCLFKRSDEKFRKRIDYSKIDKQLLRKEFEHLIPEQIYEPWIDEFIHIVGLKVHLDIIERTGEKIPWPTKDVQRVWDAYRKQQHEYQMIHSF